MVYTSRETFPINVFQCDSVESSLLEMGHQFYLLVKAVMLHVNTKEVEGKFGNQEQL